MPDMSEFDEANIHAPRVSKIDIALETLDVDDPQRAAALREALASPVYTGVAVARVLQRWGYRVSPDSVRNWRAKQR